LYCTKFPHLSKSFSKEGHVICIEWGTECNIFALVKLPGIFRDNVPMNKMLLSRWSRWIHHKNSDPLRAHHVQQQMLQLFTFCLLTWSFLDWHDLFLIDMIFTWLTWSLLDWHDLFFYIQTKPQFKDKFPFWRDVQLKLEQQAMVKIS
jgi:hypothetical protein